MTTHMMIFQTNRYARMGVHLELANAIVLQYAERAENLLLQQELFILQSEQLDRKLRVKQAEKDAKEREKREAKDAKTLRRALYRNMSSANVSFADDATIRADMYSTMFTPPTIPKRRAEGGNHQMYGNLFETKDMRGGGGGGGGSGWF